MEYQISHNIDKEKIFLINRSEIEGRLEPNYYRPSISTLENKIRSLSKHRLRDYAISISGGATPKKTKSERYYSDSQSGIPFLRVQNLQTDGELSLDGCLYIKEETHNGLLCRSKVEEGDLLVKITGVGRMAIASVAPKGFIGNTNQHMVVIKTDNTSISRYLARYLNLDIIERIASRHSTGGTRPALDYPSLKNIPVIKGIDFTPIDNALIIRKQKEYEAQQLLDSINGYILEELGIILPEIQTDLKNRIFYAEHKNCITRLDPKYNKQISYIKSLSCKYSWTTLAQVILNTGQYGANEAAIDFKDGDIRYIRITDIDEDGNLKNFEKKTAANIKCSYLLHKNDVLFARSGSVGRCYIHKNDNEPAIFAGYLIRFMLNTEMMDPWFLFYYCNSSIYKYWVDTIQRPAVQANINAEEYRSMIIPLPPLPKQKKIVEHINAVRQEAELLRRESKMILEKAKQDVEQMILGNDF